MSSVSTRQLTRIDSDRNPESQMYSAGRGSAKTLLRILFIVLLTQRLAIPLGGGNQIPVTILGVTGIVAAGVLRRKLSINRQRLASLSLAILAICLLTIVSIIRLQAPSLLSVALIVIIYGMATISPSSLTAADLRALYRTFIGLMLGAAFVSIGQILLQIIGFEYVDFLGYVLPEQLLINSYNTADPIAYGSDIYRSNALIFAEPSFLSFFLGLAVILAVHLRYSAAVIIILIGGIVPTLAGNGLFVIGFSILVLLFSQQRRSLRRLVAPLLLAILVAALTPLGAIFIDRGTEVGSQDSSASLRLVQPYQEFFEPVLIDDVNALVGFGAGAVSDVIDESGQGGLLAPVVPKLIYEYGLIGLTTFLVFFTHWVSGVSIKQQPWALGLCLAYLVLNAALLQPTLAYTTILFVTTFRVTPCVSPSGAGNCPQR